MKAWIARDMDELLWFYATKPHKGGKTLIGGDISRIAKLNKDEFPEVKWEDEEPTEIEITIKIKEK